MTPVRGERGTKEPEGRLKVFGLDLVPDVSGALFLPEHQALIVADLHFEKGSAFAARGVHLPPYDTRSTLFQLRRLVERYRPSTVVALGDSFHDGGAGARIAPDDARDIRALTGLARWIWITGNHDPEPPDDLGGEIQDSFDLGPLLLRHIPRPAPATGEIAGHLHPVAAVVTRGRRLRRRCFATDGARLVMPAFGAFTGGLNVRASACKGIFEDGRFVAWMIGRDRVYPVSSRKLLPGD
ncbi:MAG: ligase-associated DNA damage response endonuclease PdeM [Hyphomicrobiales bacterium]